MICQINLVGVCLLGVGWVVLINQFFVVLIYEYSWCVFVEFMYKVWDSYIKQSCEIIILVVDKSLVKIVQVEVICDELGLEVWFMVMDIIVCKQVEVFQMQVIEEVEWVNWVKFCFFVVVSYDLWQLLVGFVFYIVVVESKLSKIDELLVSGMKNCVVILSEMFLYLLDFFKFDVGVVLL